MPRVSVDWVRCLPRVHTSHKYLASLSKRSEADSDWPPHHRPMSGKQRILLNFLEQGNDASDSDMGKGPIFKPSPPRGSKHERNNYRA